MLNLLAVALWVFIFGIEITLIYELYANIANTDCELVVVHHNIILIYVNNMRNVIRVIRIRGIRILIRHIRIMIIKNRLYTTSVPLKTQLKW